MSHQAAESQSQISSHPTVQYLGDVIGGSSHFGHCPKCGSQHVSTHDRVVVVHVGTSRQIWCDRCAGVPAVAA